MRAARPAGDFGHPRPCQLATSKLTAAVGVRTALKIERCLLCIGWLRDVRCLRQNIDAVVLSPLDPHFYHHRASEVSRFSLGALGFWKSTSRAK